MINTRFWADNYISELDPTEKLLFLYLLTNEHTNMLGAYEIPIRRIAFDTGIDKHMVLKIMQRFEADLRAQYTDGYVIIYNFPKHQTYNKNMINSALASADELPESVKNTQGFRTLCQGFRTHDEGFEILENEIELEREREIERENETQTKSNAGKPADVVDYQKFVDAWNEIYQSNIRLTQSKRTQIKARLRTFSQDEIIQAMHKRSFDHWLNNEGAKHRTNWDSFFRNDEKVERYLNATIQDLQRHANHTSTQRKSGGQILDELFAESRANYQ